MQNLSPPAPSGEPHYEAEALYVPTKVNLMEWYLYVMYSMPCVHKSMTLYENRDCGIEQYYCNTIIAFYYKNELEQMHMHHHNAHVHTCRY